MPNSHDLSEIGQAAYDILIKNQEALGLADVFFGDQNLIARTPTACVEPGTVTRDLNQTGFTTTNTVRLYVMVYHGQVQDKQVNRKESLQFAEAIEEVFHTPINKDLGGLLVQGFFDEIDAGFAVRADSWFMVTRMSYIGISKTGLYT